MNYVKINDETKYIYGMLQRFFRPSPQSAFPRDAAKEKELYGLKDTFHKARGTSGKIQFIFLCSILDLE